MSFSQTKSSDHGYVVPQERRQDTAFTVQCRVLHALILRELKARYGSRRLGFLWAIIEPIVFMTVFVTGFYLIGRTSQSGVDAPLFFVAGFVPFFMFRDVNSDIASGTKGNLSLLMFPQVTRMDILFSKLVVNSAISASVFVLLYIGLRVFGFEFILDNPLGVLIGFVLIIALGFGTGLVLGALAIRYEFISALSSPLLGRPLFMTSGLFFSASMLPPRVREIFLYNPLLHCIEYIRVSLFEAFDSRYVNLNYVFIFALVQICFGLMLLNLFERRRK